MASDWPALQPRLCREPDKESRAGARCRRWEPREDEVGAEERTCPPWAGGAAGRQGPCGCARPCTRAAPWPSRGAPGGVVRGGESGRIPALHVCVRTVSGCRLRQHGGHTPKSGTLVRWGRGGGWRTPPGGVLKGSWTRVAALAAGAILRVQPGSRGRAAPLRWPRSRGAAAPSCLVEGGDRDGTTTDFCQAKPPGWVLGKWRAGRVWGLQTTTSILRHS